MGDGAMGGRISGDFIFNVEIADEQWALDGIFRPKGAMDFELMGRRGRGFALVLYC